MDVSPEKFVEGIKKYHASIVVMEGTMVFAAESMRRSIQAIERAGLRGQVRILLGGSGIYQEAAHQAGADGYSSDFVSGVALCKRWLEQAGDANG